MLTKKDSEEKIKITLKDYADVFFDVWLESKSNKKI